MARAEDDKRASARGSRRRSRELALQAIYQWLLAGGQAEALCGQAAENSDYLRSDRAYFDALVHGVIADASQLDASLQPFLDRPVGQLSPIEHALLLIAGHELTARPEVPYRVVINEAVELAKSYGGTEGHRYVNGVLDKLAAQVRTHEVRK